MYQDHVMESIHTNDDVTLPIRMFRFVYYESCIHGMFFPPKTLNLENLQIGGYTGGYSYL